MGAAAESGAGLGTRRARRRPVLASCSQLFGQDESRTAAELARSCEQEFDGCDVLLMAAAVADFGRATPAQRKLTKDRGVPTVELEPTEDVVSVLAGRRRPGQVIVGFAADDGEGAIESARGKLERKRLDLLVVNDISLPGIGCEVFRERGHDPHRRGKRAPGAASRQARGRANGTRRGRAPAREKGGGWSRRTGRGYGPQEFEAFAAIARRVPKNVCRAVQVLARQR